MRKGLATPTPACPFPVLLHWLRMGGGLQMHRLIGEHNLGGCVRWVVAQKNPRRNGELYRMIAGKAFHLKHAAPVRVDRVAGTACPVA